jgi:hypothetical protein
MGKARGEPGAGRPARRVREGAPGNGPPETAKPRPWAYLTPARNAVLLVAGDKAGRWQEWYQEAIPAAEAAYEAYLKEQR